jgi:aminomethyltransferase
MLKRTPLFAAHQKLGARLVEFGGWEMPVQYTSIMDEHQAVRTAAGVFDISHMGEVLLSGPDAERFLNHVLTNDIRKLAVGQGQYTLMCNEQGGVVDDLYAYRLEDQLFLLIINASRIPVDVAWLERQFNEMSIGPATRLANASGETGAVAVQGPRVAEFIDACFEVRPNGGTPIEHISELKKNQVIALHWDSKPIWVSRTGYTGEDGFEIVGPAQVIEPIWEQLLRKGKPFGLQPCGLGARDTLRTEVCYPLYGHELDEQTTPLEAGLGFFIAFDKADFIGRSVLAEQKANGLRRRCVAFKMTDRSAPPRPHYPIWSAGPVEVRLGEVASGTLSPSLGIGIGMGYVPPQFAKTGTAIQIEIRSKRATAVVVPKPIYKKPV